MNKIKKVEIKNFESHENTELSFCDGFNVIYGTSNIGKSAILRAIELVSYGEWAGGENKKEDKSGPVRAGEKFCEVTLTCNNGIVKVQRGTGVNNWVLENFLTGKKRDLSSPGVGRIEGVEDIVGLKIKEIGDRKLKFNWSAQRDKHFMIDEIEGKPASPSLVAAVIDEVAGLSGAEDLIRAVVKDKSNVEKKIKENFEKIGEIKEELVLYDDVELERKKIEEVELKIKEITQKNSKLEYLKNILDALNTNKDKLDNAKRKLESLKSISKLMQDAKSIRIKHEKLNALLNFNKSLVVLEENISKVTKNVNLTKNLRKISKQIVKLKQRLNDYLSLLKEKERIFVVFSKIDNLKKTEKKKISVDIKNVKDILLKSKKLSSLVDQNNNIIKLNKKISTMKKRYEMADELYNEKIKEKKDIVSSFDVCLYCGEKMTEKHRKFMMEN